MKAVELRSKTESELKDMLISLKRELMNLRFQRINGELANTSRFSLARREVARIKTVLREKRA